MIHIAITVDNIHQVMVEILAGFRTDLKKGCLMIDIFIHDSSLGPEDTWPHLICKKSPNVDR